MRNKTRNQKKPERDQEGRREKKTKRYKYQFWEGSTKNINACF